MLQKRATLTTLFVLLNAAFDKGWLITDQLIFLSLKPKPHQSMTQQLNQHH